MSFDPTAKFKKSYCNYGAIDRGLDPVGHGGDFDTAIIVEMPLPWKYNIAQQEGLLPQEMTQLLDLWLQRYREGHGYRQRPLIIAPEQEYNVDGYRRVMFYTRPEGKFAQFDKVEYLVPDDKLGPLCWSLYETRHLLADFEQYRVHEGDTIRDLLICTHGAVDAACGKFGYPLYKSLRDTYADDHLRVWRVSHFGGHIFAPTLMDMPMGHYWAYVGDEQAKQIVQRSGNVEIMRGHLRGWAGASYGFAQVADCELWQTHGWDWFDTNRSAEIIAQDDADNPQWAEIAIEYQHPDTSSVERTTMRVEISHTIKTNPSTGKDHAYEYPQYRIVKSEQVARAVADE